MHVLTTNLNPLFPAISDEDFSVDYPIDSRYKVDFEDILPKWRATPLAAYDVAGKLIKVHSLETSLMGALVLVYFTLKHYPIREKAGSGVSNNTFTAIATQVKVLEAATERGPSPYKSQMMKGPKYLPQSPSKKRDQARAVAAFHPGTLRNR